MSIRLWAMGYAAFATHLVYGSKQYIAEVKGKKKRGLKKKMKMKLIQVWVIAIQGDKSGSYSSTIFLENMIHSSGGSDSDSIMKQEEPVVIKITSI